MARTHWLAFDIGTTGTKAALITQDRRVIRSAYREYPTSAADGGVMEQNAADWWQAVCDACLELDARDEIGAIVVTGQMQDAVLVDAQGSPVRPVILYSDTRARAEADEVNTIIGAERLRGLTGNDQDASSLLAKLRWLVRYEPDNLKAAAHLLLGAADFITLQMTGVAVTDTTTASTTGLMDMTTRAALDRSWLDRLGISDWLGLVPPMQPGGAQVGALTDAAAESLSLPAGLPVYHAPGDAGAATIGAGSGESGQAYLYIGTSGWVAFTASTPANPDTGVFTLAHPRPGTVIQVAPLLTAGGNLEWVRDLFGTDEYDVLTDFALRREPSNLLYLPYLNGERAPFRDPLARGAFIGLHSQTDKIDLYRAVLEGVVYAYRHALDALISTPISILTLTGGGTRSQAWCQLFADIINLPVAIAADAEHVGLQGAMIAAQVADSQLDNYAPASLFPVTTTLQPGSQHRQHFDHQYTLFCQAYPALKPIFQQAEALNSPNDRF